MLSRSLLVFVAMLAVILSGCQTPDNPQSGGVSPPPTAATAANAQFTSRKSYDPWVLSGGGSSDYSVPAYISDGHTACLVDGAGKVVAQFQAGHYVNDSLEPVWGSPSANAMSAPPLPQFLDMKKGQLGTQSGSLITFSAPGLKLPDWPKIWAASDIAIEGDPEAQEVVHSEMFYLLSSTYPGSDHSIPPLGLSSTTYGGHIFWDADTWMFPALVAQHPDYAKSIVDYRFKTLGQAEKNAKAHGYPGAEYAWESASTGAEVAPAEFAKERHITADVALAAWQYYLWTGDEDYLRKEGWPILKAAADYWVKRATLGTDGNYHIKNVLPPDETAGDVDDDAYTNGAVRATLLAAIRTGSPTGGVIDPMWRTIASKLVIPTDKTQGFPAEYANAAGKTTGPAASFEAKQADTLLLLYPLNAPYGDGVAQKMLDYYAAHTIKTGPAMTSGIHAVIAARLGHPVDALSYFQESYRPFMRGPWNAFSEKRTTNNVYFLTGMAGSLQSVLYGFAGLRVVAAGDPPPPHGKRLAGDNVAELYADPHLPPGWGKLSIQGIHFRGRVLNLTVNGQNAVTVSP